MQTTILTPEKLANEKSDASPNFAHPWLPDQRDGTYCNPVLYADYSDPDVIRAGEDFYLVASSFNCTPGLPILHSKDLVNWRIINHALKNLPHPRYEKVQPGCGVWAPSIRFHAGKFWIFFPMPDEGIYVVTANHPAGKWSEPHLLQAGKGLIDPCPLWDDDGRAYLVHAYAGSRAGIKHRLRVCPMAPDGSKLLGEGEIGFHQPEKHPILEGPKFLKRDGWYYIFAPAGGVETGWQVALRSKKIYGPYEDKIVLEQGDTDINGPHQGALVDTADDGWWFVHFQDAGVYGRIVHLQPVEWRDGWPLMGDNGDPVRQCCKPFILSEQKIFVPQTSDDFNGEKLGLQWQWHANHRDDWHSLTARPGWLRLFPQASVSPLNEQPNLLLQKFPARSFIVETTLQLFALQGGEEAGLVIAGEKTVMFGLQYDGTKNWLVLRTDELFEKIRIVNTQPVRLRVAVRDGGRFSFSFADDGEFISLPGTFQANKGKWIGAKLGLYSIKIIINAPAGHADFDRFLFF
jgi:beta-xylosidase